MESRKHTVKKISKIIVLGLIREKDRTLRERMETHLVGDLKDMGYDASCSCDEYNSKTFENLTEEQAIGKLRDSGVDAVLTVVLLDKTKERYYVPGRVQYTPFTIYHNRFWGIQELFITGFIQKATTQKTLSTSGNLTCMI